LSTPNVPNNIANAPKYEKTLEKMSSYEAARNKAMKILGDLGHDAKSKYGELGDAIGKKTGRITFDNKAHWRLDWDPTKGPHINVADFRLGKKGNGGILIAIPFEGDYETYIKLLEHLNR